ncbi:lamin tail domain-containing protein 1 isoform X2 [Tamandua tetradactyla]|uniref:lamin tail domain-containing protein 1 isoform X2 n=1 Tax=Tamandua tetradactyla TaxID=48850 RepID=UPI0040540AB0
MKKEQALPEALAAKLSEVCEQEDEVEKRSQREKREISTEMTQRSSVHFFPMKTSSDATTLPPSQSLSSEMPLAYYLLSSQTSSLTTPTTGQKPSKSSLMNHSRTRSSYGINNLVVSKKQPLLDFAPETAVIGEGEDYFHSLFGDSKKLASTSHVEKSWKHFSMILEEEDRFRSSALGDIKIAEVNIKGLFVKLVNSSTDKELDIGDHILQQKINGETISFYRFVPNVIMQANSSVTVWAAASEAKHQPPSNFLWKEQNNFRASPNCTTILCKPNGEAIAWYTPIHWKQAWEKLETDIEFGRCSVLTPTSQRHVFWWPKSTTTITKDKQQKDISQFQMEKIQVLLKREKQIPPALIPPCSPWCHSPNVPPHPYCSLIDPHRAHTAKSRLMRQPRPQSARPDPASGTSKIIFLNKGYMSPKTKKLTLQSSKDMTIKILRPQECSACHSQTSAHRRGSPQPERK